MFCLLSSQLIGVHCGIGAVAAGGVACEGLVVVGCVPVVPATLQVSDSAQRFSVLQLGPPVHVLNWGISLALHPCCPQPPVVSQFPQVHWRVPLSVVSFLGGCAVVAVDLHSRRQLLYPSWQLLVIVHFHPAGAAQGEAFSHFGLAGAAASWSVTAAPVMVIAPVSVNARDSPSNARRDSIINATYSSCTRFCMAAFQGAVLINLLMQTFK